MRKLLVVVLAGCNQGLAPPPTVAVTFDTAPDMKCGGVYDGQFVWTASHCAKWWMAVNGVDVEQAISRWDVRDLARAKPVQPLTMEPVTIRCDVPGVAYVLGRQVTVDMATTDHVVLSGYDAANGASGHPVYDGDGKVFAVLVASQPGRVLAARMCP